MFDIIWNILAWIGLITVLCCMWLVCAWISYMGEQPRGR